MIKIQTRSVLLKIPPFQWFLLLSLAFLGGGIIFFMTSRWGIGVSPDSCVYISIASNFLKGQGLTLTAADGLVPVTEYGPLFSLLLAWVSSVFKVDTFGGAKILQSLVFGANILLVEWILVEYSRSWRLALLGAFIFMVSPSMLIIHSMAWSETLFVFFLMAGCFLLSRYLESKKKGFLVAASLASGLAFLSRYVGIALVFSAVLCLLLLNKRPVGNRIKDSFLFLVLSCPPMGLWTLRNFILSGVPARGETLGFHPPSFDYYRWALSSFSLWFLPPDVDPLIRGIFCLLIFSVFIGGLFWLKNKEVLFPIFAIFSLSYLAAYFLNLVLFATDPMDDRAAAALFCSAFPLFALLGCRLWRENEKKFLRAGLILTALFFVTSYSFRAFHEISDIYSQGRGFSGKAWRNSEIIGKIKSLPEEIKIYSNGSDIIYFLTGKLTRSFPAKGSGSLLHLSDEPARSTYDPEMGALKNKLKIEGGILVYFNRVSRTYLAAEEDLKKYLSLQLLEKFSDGAIYQPPS